MSQHSVATVFIGLLTMVGSAGFAQDQAPDAPVQETLQEAVQKPVQDLVQKPVQEPVKESVQDPVEEQIPDSESAVTDSSAHADLSDVELLRQEFLRYRQLLDEGITDEADAAAKRVIELSIRVNGPTSIDTARALTNLAIVQQINEQYGAAQQNFQSAVDIIEDREDRLNKLLINPLTGLGKAQLEAGRPDLAAQTFQRAVHITHVNEGPHNMDQIELLESLAETNLRLGLLDDAKRVHDTVYALNLRYYRSQPLALVPSLMRRANWQHRTGFINDERATYRRVIRIVETTSGKSDIRLVPPLMNLGKSYFFQDLSGESLTTMPTAASGELYYKRAVAIARESEQSNWQILSDSLIGLADYYLFMNSLARASSNYEEAWQILSEDEERLRRRSLVLEQPNLLRSNTLPRFAESADDADMLDEDTQLKQGKLDYEFFVSPRGRISEFKVTSQNPAEFEDMRRFLGREMRTRVYRPKFTDEGPVPSEKLTGTHRFYYKQADLDALTLDKEQSGDDSETSSESE